jgi:hypothetical protein
MGDTLRKTLRDPSTSTLLVCAFALETLTIEIVRRSARNEEETFMTGEYFPVMNVNRLPSSLEARDPK